MAPPPAVRPAAAPSATPARAGTGAARTGAHGTRTAAASGSPPSGPSRRRRRWARPLLALVLVAPPLGFAAFALHVARPHVAPGAPVAGGIAVLTGGPDRLERGLALLAASPEARLLVTGVGRDVTLADLLPEDPDGLAGRIALGHTATSTRGNAREVLAWVREEGLPAVTVVTAGYHMPRALLELRRALPGVALHPDSVTPNLARPGPMVREYAKLLGAALGLSILSDRPRPLAGRR